MKRISSIDIARGLVMIIMALDHTRDFLHVASQTGSPTNLATTTPILFFTRWITYLCAPTFVFLSGTSAWISLQNRPEGAAGRRFLLSRGLWLVILEFTIVNFALWWDIHFRILIFQVIAAIGFGWIILSLFYKVSPAKLGIAGLIIIFGHDIVSLLMVPMRPVFAFFADLFFSPGLFSITPHFSFLIAYPILPWLGIMLTGFAAGQIFLKPTREKKKIFFSIGLAAMSLFVLLRGINIYGDPSRWSVQKSGVFTFLSFVNVSKYPPSLQYALLMLGCLFGFLAFVEGRDNRFLRILSVYGRTPLFYYLIHFYILHLILFIMVFAQGFHPADLVFGPMKFGLPASGSGVSLLSVYLIWISVVIGLYPLCRWYGRYRSGHPEKKWLRYL
jgi:uncharacterized membrane protein